VSALPSGTRLAKNGVADKDLSLHVAAGEPMAKQTRRPRKARRRPSGSLTDAAVTPCAPHGRASPAFPTRRALGDRGGCFAP
jgi:hypothetical protein